MVKALVTFGSVSMAAFGIWHFFVPAAWGWYSYMAPEATELVLAVRATNVFFSLCLVLIGVADILFVFFSPNRFSLMVMLSLSTILWAVRCVMQIAYPQGSMTPALQYGMLAAFAVIFACYLISLLITVLKPLHRAGAGQPV